MSTWTLKTLTSKPVDTPKGTRYEYTVVWHNEDGVELKVTEGSFRRAKRAAKQIMKMSEIKIS